MKSLGRLWVSSITGVACEKLVTAATAIASNHLFAKVYGPQQFGQLQFALSLTFAIGSAALLFSAQAVTPILGKHPRLRHLVYYTTFRLRLYSTFAVLAALILGVWLTMDLADARLLFAVSIVLAVEPFNLGLLTAYVDRRPWIVTRAKALASGVRLLWLYAAAHFSLGAVVASLAWPFEAFVAVAAPFVRYGRFALHTPSSLVGRQTVKHALITRGVKFWPAVAASVIIARVDRIMLGALLSKTDFGVYSAAASLIEQWNAVGTALALALAPSLVFVARNELQLRSRAMKLGLYLGLIAAIAFAVSLVLGHAVFVMIYGRSFEEGAPVMIYSTGCSIVSFADAGLATWLLAGRRYRLALIKQGITLATIVASPFLAPHTLVMYAPATANALVTLVFWCIVFAPRAQRVRAPATTAAAVTLSESHD